MNWMPSISLPGLSGGIGSLGIALPAPTPPMMWIAVRQRFELFNENTQLTPLQYGAGLKNRGSVVESLNRAYYGASSDSDNSFLIGSWGKATTVRPPRDVDLYFQLPPSAYHRFQKYLGNRQSALLQEVKSILSATYPNTEMRGDGQVVIVRFDAFHVEVVPAFLLTTGRYWICDTSNGGSYKETDPWAELSVIESLDGSNNRNLRPLTRMLKTWQDYCSVPIKSFHLELVAADFLMQSPWREKDFFWFDWIIRDFFAYLYQRANTFVYAPGTQEAMHLGSDWQSRSLTAYNRAAAACNYERDNWVDSAGEEWQKIFGTAIPRTV